MKYNYSRLRQDMHDLETELRSMKPTDLNYHYLQAKYTKLCSLRAHLHNRLHMHEISHETRMFLTALPKAGFILEVKRPRGTSAIYTWTQDHQAKLVEPLLLLYTLEDSPSREIHAPPVRS